LGPRCPQSELTVAHPICISAVAPPPSELGSFGGPCNDRPRQREGTTSPRRAISPDGAHARPRVAAQLQRHGAHHDCELSASATRQRHTRARGLASRRAPLVNTGFPAGLEQYQSGPASPREPSTSRIPPPLFPHRRSFGEGRRAAVEGGTATPWRPRARARHTRRPSTRRRRAA
jgi:hypothetical protein